jgi:dihydrodipicolinate synthase/N-acetylneuraminate lyase
MTRQDARVFTGAGVALVTLFDDAGEVDYAATAAHASRLAELGVTAIVVAGTTGEVDALTDDERLRLFDAVRAAVPPSSGVAVVAGTGATSTRHARALTSSARGRGADAFLARSPRAVANPTGYYRAIAEAAGDTPVLAYHFPRVSPPGIPLELLPNLPVVGCKDSSGSPDRMLATLTTWSGALYVGTAALLVQAGALGAAGAILALANAEPELCVAAFAGDADAQLKLVPGHQAAAAAFPSGIKGLVAKRFGVSEAARIA